MDLPNISGTNTIYAAFKDKAGNTTTIYTGEDTKYTVNYDANGGTGAPAAQTTYYGMPLYTSSERPTYEGKYFVGWSTNKSATEAMYVQNTFMPASEFKSSEKNITLYAIWTDEVSELPLLADRVKVGDYVKYPVYYDNVTTNRDPGEYIASLNGWRVLSVSGDTVNLVSAGVPLRYYHYNNSETSIKNLAINLLDIPLAATGNCTFRETGFNPYLTLRETFNNKYTAVYESDEIVSYTSTYNDGRVVTYSGEKKAGDLKVRSMTKEDLDKVYDPTGENITVNGTNVTAAEYQGLLAIPCSDKTSSYARYWLASAYSSYALRTVVNSGQMTCSNDGEFGVRPVVSLKSTVKTTGTDMIGAWNIEVE